MSNSTAQSASPENKGVPGAGTMKMPPPRETIVSQQAQTLTSLAIPFMQFIANANIAAERGEVSKMDGGIKCAVESTLMAIAGRIEKLAADDRCWGVDGRVTIEQASLDVLQAKHAQTILAMAPHSCFQPNFRKLDSGHWVVYLGNLDVPSERVTGVGESIAEALAAFDLEFTAKEQQFKYEQKQRMDNGRNPDTATTPQEGSVPVPDGGETKPIRKQHRRRPVEAAKRSAKSRG